MKFSCFIAAASVLLLLNVRLVRCQNETLAGNLIEALLKFVGGSNEELSEELRGQLNVVQQSLESQAGALEDIKDQVDVIEDVALDGSLRCAGVVVSGHCVTLHNQRYNFKTANDTCAVEGQVLVKIFTEHEYRTVMDYIRSSDVITDRSQVYVWTAMDLQGFSEHDEDSDASGEHDRRYYQAWLPSYPKSNPNFLHVAWQVVSSSMFGDGGFLNVPAEATAYPLCSYPVEQHESETESTTAESTTTESTTTATESTTTTTESTTTETTTPQQVVCGVPTIGSQSKIVGGDVAEPGTWPWQVWFKIDHSDRHSTPYCGGTVVADRWVVTAAHCTDGNARGLMRVILGDWDRTTYEDHEREFAIAEVFQFPNYTINSYEISYDISLLKLQGRVVYTDYILPACLPSQGEPVDLDAECWISGWGRTENEFELTDMLREARVHVLTNEQCQNIWGSGILISDDSHICTNTSQDVGTCNGDSGGPLACKNAGKFYVQGATSFGSSVSCTHRPSAFTRVAQFRDWIDRTMQENADDTDERWEGTPCGSSVTSGQMIRLPVEPDTLLYSPNLECKYIMSPPSGQIYTRLRFVERFDIQYQNASCPYDHLKLLDTSGNFINGTRLCGSEIPANSTHVNVGAIQFNSDGISQYQGFSVYVDFLEFSFCHSDPCMMGSNCVDIDNGYLCQCLPGWTGQNCSQDVDECASSPCQNGGICTTPEFNSYLCDCADGWAGVTCDYQCSIELDASSDLTDIYSPNYPDNYFNYADCYWILRAVSSASNIELKVVDSSLENYYDYLRIYDGDSTAASRIVELTGYQGQGTTYFSTGSDLYIHFQSDYSITRRGFHLQFRETTDLGLCESNPCENGGACSIVADGNEIECLCREGTEGEFCEVNCQGEYDATSEWATLHSANYPNNYYNDESCNWLLNSADTEMVVVLETLDIQLEDGYDYLTIYDGADQSATVIASLTGSPALSNYTSSGTEMFVAFTSDEMITDKGFQLRYKSVVDTSACSSSPCENGATCSNTGEHDYTCSCQDGFFGENCELSCRGEFDATSDWATINSPHYPNDYHNRASCTWLLHSTHAKNIVVLETLDIQLENGYDYLTIYDGADQFATVIASLTGSPGLETYESSGTDMFIVFTSDSSITDDGFELRYKSKRAWNACESNPCENGANCTNTGAYSYTCSCPNGFIGENCQLTCQGEYGATSEWATLQSANYPNYYFNDSSCNWLLNSADTEMVVVLETVDIQLEYGWDYLTIYDGADQYATVIASLTGSPALRTYNSSGAQMFVVFTSDGSVTDKGFQLRYKSSSVDFSIACESNPCENGAECTDIGHYAYNCSCPDGFVGENCQYDDLCSPNPCVSGDISSGSCTQVEDVFSCECVDGSFTGTLCKGRRHCGTRQERSSSISGKRYKRNSDNAEFVEKVLERIPEDPKTPSPPVVHPPTSSHPIKRIKRNIEKDHPAFMEDTLAKIVGGNNAVKGDWPWQIGYAVYGGGGIGYGQICGGILVSANWAITAAHCTDGHPTDGSQSVAILGQHVEDKDDDNDGTRKFFAISQIVNHPEYNRYTMDNDIALLKLAGEVVFTDYIQPVCLPTQGLQVPVGTECWITGWGETEAAPTDILQEAVVEIVSNADCQNWSGLTISELMVCAGYRAGGIDTCQGDSGGPLVCVSSVDDDVFILHGVTSHGIGCAEQDKPGVYTRMSEFVAWTEHTTSTNNSELNEASLFGLPMTECGTVISSNQTVRLPVDEETQTYLDNWRCTWTIEPPANTANTTISFTGDRFHIEAESGSSCYDSLQVIQGDNTIETICGNVIPGDITVAGEGHITMTFQSNGSWRREGFAASISFEYYDDQDL